MQSPSPNENVSEYLLGMSNIYREKGIGRIGIRFMSFSTPIKCRSVIGEFILDGIMRRNNDYTGIMIIPSHYAVRSLH